MIGRNEDTYFLRRNMKFFSGEKFNRDLAFADWRPMYREDNCDEIFTKFNEIFQSIFDKHAPIQICDSSIKQNKKSDKPWISSELKKLIIEKYHLYNQYKFSQNYDVFDEFKKFRNLVNQKLRDAHHKYSVYFFKQYETSKLKWNFINRKLGHHKQGIIVSEIEIHGAKTVDKKAICNAFNKSFAEIGKYSCDFVPLNINSLDYCFEKINFRVLNSKEIYKTIDNLENSKSHGPGFVHVWALKAAKYAIGTHLLFIFNKYIQNSVFPTVLKHAYVTPIHKKGSTTQVCNYRPISVTPNRHRGLRTNFR